MTSGIIKLGISLPIHIHGCSEVWGVLRELFTIIAAKISSQVYNFEKQLLHFVLPYFKSYGFVIDGIIVLLFTGHCEFLYLVSCVPLFMPWWLLSVLMTREVMAHYLPLVIMPVKHSCSVVRMPFIRLVSSSCLPSGMHTSHCHQNICGLFPPPFFSLLLNF